MTDPRIDPLVAEAMADREHQERMAKIQADRDVRVTQAKADSAESRHQVYMWIIGVTGALLLVGGIIAAITLSMADSRQKKAEFERDATVSELCVHRGDIWVNDSCVPARRES